MGLNAVLRAWHVMLGRDMHIPWPPGSPSPAPSPVPYMTTAPMVGMVPMLTSKLTATAFADSMCSMMVRGTDIGPLIPHVGPPSTTLPIDMLTSGSKSYFGVTKWKVKDQTGAAGCVAVGVLGLTNLNLNCGSPAPTPFGLVIAPTTHLATLTLGDLVSGLYMMAWDYMAQRIMYMAGQAMGDVVSKMVRKVAARLGVGVLSRTAARQMARALGTRSNIGPVANALRAQRIAALTKVADRATIALGLAAGSPLGISTSTLGDDHAKSAYDRVADAVDPQGHGDALGQAIDDYFSSPSSSVTDVPSAPDQVATGGDAPDASTGADAAGSGDGGAPDTGTGDAGASNMDGSAGDAGQGGDDAGMSSPEQGDGGASSSRSTPTSSVSSDPSTATSSVDPSSGASTDGENACTPESGSDDADGNSSR
jgi:hypothetical protein